ncbi:MAG: hypothetical protein U0269_21545 [Polyangiales bacterium]
MATRIDLSDYQFFPLAVLDSTGARLAVSELPVVRLFDTSTGNTIEEFRWIEGDPESDEAPTRLARDGDEDDEDDYEDEDYEEELYESVGIPVLIDFSPDGRHFFVACSHHSGSMGSNDCYLFDVTRAGAPLRFVSIEKAMRDHKLATRDSNYNDPAAVAFTPDGGDVVVVGSFGALFFSVFDANKTRSLALPDARNKNGTTYAGRDCTAIAFREQRGALSWCDSLWLFDRDELERVRELRAPGATRLGQFLAFRDDDTLVVTSSEYVDGDEQQRDVHTVDLRTNEWTSMRMPATVRWLARDGRTALCSHNSGHDLVRVDLVTGEAATIPRAKSGGKKPSRLLSISADGSTIARTFGGLELGLDAKSAVITRRVKKG